MSGARVVAKVVAGYLDTKRFGWSLAQSTEETQPGGGEVKAGENGGRN